MPDYLFYLPADFKDYEQEVTAKGFFAEAKIICLGKTYSIHFYDPARLSQEIEDEIRHDAVFFESNLVIVRSVTGSGMAQAAGLLVRSGRMKFLASD